MQVGAIGCADFSKPFVMPTGSTFKDVGGRANVVAVVYVPDPVGQLTPAQVAKYALHIGRTQSLKLPLRPGAATGPNMNREFGTSSSTPTPNPPLIDGTSSSKESDDDNDTTTITYPAVQRHSAFDPTFTHPLHAEGGGGNRARARRRATMSGVSLSAHIDRASSTTQSQFLNLCASEARNVEARDVGCVATDQGMARTMMPAQTGLKHWEGETGGSIDGRRQSGIVRPLEYGVDHGIGARERTVVQPSPWSDASSEDSDSVHVLSRVSPRADGRQSAATLEAQFGRRSVQRSYEAGGGTEQPRHCKRRRTLSWRPIRNITRHEKRKVWMYLILMSQ